MKTNLEHFEAIVTLTKNNGLDDNFFIEAAPSLTAVSELLGMDKAFERRFLYKIEFENPGEEVKTAIWQSIMPDLTGEDAGVLSRRFDFSGGQIDNIARKEAVSSILRGGKLSLNDIIALCDEELIDKKAAAKIGFHA